MNRLPFFKAIAPVIAFSKALTGIACFFFQGNSPCHGLFQGFDMNRLPFFKAIATVIAFSKALTGIACLFPRQ